MIQDLNYIEDLNLPPSNGQATNPNNSNLNSRLSYQQFADNSNDYDNLLQNINYQLKEVQADPVSYQNYQNDVKQQQQLDPRQ